MIIFRVPVLQRDLASSSRLAPGSTRAHYCLTKDMVTACISTIIPNSSKRAFFFFFRLPEAVQLPITTSRPCDSPEVSRGTYTHHLIPAITALCYYQRQWLHHAISKLVLPASSGSIPSWRQAYEGGLFFASHPVPEIMSSANRKKKLLNLGRSALISPSSPIPSAARLIGDRVP